MIGLGTQIGMFSQPVEDDIPSFGNNSRFFDSTHIVVPSNSSLSFTDGTTDSPFSIAFWIKRASGGRFDISKYTDTSPVGEWSASVTPAGEIAFQTIDGAPTIRCRRDTTSSPITADTWHHIVVVYDGSADDDAISFYVAGSPIASTAKGNDGSYSNMEITTQNLNIGNLLIDSGLTFNSEGHAADIRIYSAELSPAQVAALHLGTHIATNLVGHYCLDSNDVLDASGTGNNGVNSGSTYSTDGPFD